jgi:hypothetical protein
MCVLPLPLLLTVVYSNACPWLCRGLGGQSPASHCERPVSVHVGFVVDKVALGQVFLQLLWFSPVSIIPPWLSMLTYYLGDKLITFYLIGLKPSH